VSKALGLALLVVSLAGPVQAQLSTPNANQVVMYSSTLPSSASACTSVGKPCMPVIQSYNGPKCVLNTTGCPDITTPGDFGSIPAVVGLSSALSASIGTALSVIPIASPSSSVITITDPQTGALLPASSTLGPIFAERGETIGRHKVYVGLSTENFHFTSLNGQSLRSLMMFDPGGRVSNIQVSSAGGVQSVSTFPSTYNIATDVRLGQDVAFITYGVTSRFDVSVGLQVAHASIQSQMTDAQIYVGNGFNNTGKGNCWCVDTFTAGSQPAVGTTDGLFYSQVNSSRYGTTGFGDMLLRFKGTVIQRRNLSLAVGADLRLPTGNAQNFLGIGTTAVKPFLAASFYSKVLGHGVVLSPELNVGWQIAGKSILGGQIAASSYVASNGVTQFGPPFTSTKNYLPDVFSWVGGTELALGRRTTIVADIVGNEIGWLHGIANTYYTQSQFQVPQASANPTATLVTASGLVSAGRVSYGQYSGAFGYKAKIYGNLVGTFNALVRFDNNGLGLVDRSVLLFGVGYTF
jgi:hypothetical protein